MSALRALVLAAVLTAVVPAGADARLAFVCATSDICLAGDDGANPEPFTTDGSRGGNYRNPSFSADGRLLAVDSNAGTYLYTLATGRRTLLTGDEVTSAVLSPDGALLASSEQRLDADQGYYPQLCRYATGVPRTSTCETPDKPFAPGLAYGPDNRLYTTVSGVTDSICRRAATGTDCEATVVTDASHKLRDLAVSPDGARVAVNWAAADQRSVDGPIAVYDLRTGALERQLTSGSDSAPAWTPDGKAIVFTRGTTLAEDGLYTIPATGRPGDEKLLVPEARKASFGASSGSADAGIAGFGAKADGHEVAVRLIVPTSDSRLHATFKDGLGRAVVKQHVVAGRRTFAVSLSRKGRRKLTKRGSLEVRLTVTVTPPTGTTASERRTITLKR